MLKNCPKYIENKDMSLQIRRKLRITVTLGLTNQAHLKRKEDVTLDKINSLNMMK